MAELICLASLLFANLWGMGNLRETNNTEKNLPGDAAVAAGTEDRFPVGPPPIPPVKPGNQRNCDEPPCQREILRALPRVDRGVPYYCEIWRDDLEFTVEKLVDRIDPPRSYPLVGPAQLHHCHWKCTVYFTEIIESAYPFPFRTKRRRAEVVYIDKDRLHLCAAQPATPATPECCPGGHLGGKEVVKNTAAAKPAQQVQIDVMVASVRPDVLQKFPLQLFHDMGDTNVRKVGLEVLTDAKPLHEFLKTMRTDGLAKVLAEPRILTLNGQTAVFQSGGEYPVPTIDASGVRGINFTPFGTKLQMLPKVLSDGSIHLHVQAEYSAIDPRPASPRASTTPADVVPSMTTQNAQFGVQMKAGQTAVLAGLTQVETTTTTRRVPFWGSLPLLDRLFTQIGYHEEKRDLVIMLTARLVSGYGGAEASQEPAAKPMPFPMAAPEPLHRVAPPATPVPVPPKPAPQTHRVAPPDVLHIEELRLIPRVPYRLEPRETLHVDILHAYPWQNLSGDFVIAADGCINLGQTFGTVKVAGLTVDEAQAAIRRELMPIMKTGFAVRTLLVGMRGMQTIKGEHLVRPDGTVSLGMFGSVHVEGMTLGQIKCAIENHLSKYVVDPQVSVDVRSYSGKKTPVVPVTYHPVNNQPTWTSEPRIVGMKNDPALVQAAAVEAPRPTCTVAAPTPMKVSDVVMLTKAQAPDDIILKHMELTNSVFRLTTPDLLYLLESGVSPHVIRAMQERGDVQSRPVYVEPPPLSGPGARGRF